MADFSVPTGPKVSAVQWLAAKDVLGGEASDFTPWLMQQESMNILAAALKLDDLTPVAAELNVLGKRLDILATAQDENGEDIAVCIENQYGMSDASHLGRLIAYLANQGRGRAVWVVEQAHDAFVAAVRFLNRTSDEDAGYYLAQVRFTHGPGDSYQVHFEVLAAPIAWERGTKAGNAVAKPNEPKVAYLEAIHEGARAALLGAGFPSLNTHARGAYLWVRWPSSLWFRRFGTMLNIRVTRTAVAVAVFVRALPTRAANAAAMEIMQSHYAERILKSVPEGSEVKWLSAGPGRKEAVQVVLAGHGYDGGDADVAMTWAVEVATLWLELLQSDPILDLEAQVQAALPGQAVAPTNSGDSDDDLE